MPHGKDKSWTIVFDGNLLRARDRDIARKKFARRFASDPHQLDRIFSGQPIVLRSDLAHRSATKIQADLEVLGMRCRVVSGGADAANEDELTGKSQTYTEADIDAAFNGSFERPRTGLIYRFSLLCVAGLMVLLPLTYVAMVGAVGYGLVWHVVTNLPVAVDPVAQYLGLLGYGLPIVAGVILLLFLLKPFCARHKGIYAPVVLDPLRQPTLFYLVRQITWRVGAPMPSEIRVDANVNASASLRRGVFSRQLILTIGMPLFLGMSVQRLGGILAHEFGHFAQRTGMRLRVVIEHINRWFYRRAYEPDSWDRFVQRLSDSGNVFLRLAGLLSRSGIWVSRRILIVLAKLANHFCRYLSRQMEYDADRYEVRMTGSRKFRSTAVRLRVLGAGFDMALAQTQQIWRDNQLPDDLPTLATRHAQALSEAQRARIAGGIARRRVDVMDSHPPDGDRIRAAEAIKTRGVLSHTGPARRLLHHREELCRKVTFAWYRDQGYSFNAGNLVSLDVVRAELTQQDEQFEALGRYLGSGFIAHRVLPVPCLHKLLEQPQSRLRAALRAWRQPLDAGTMKALCERYTDRFDRLVSLAAAETLSRLHLPFDHGAFGAVSADTAQVQGQSRTVLDDYEALQKRLRLQENALAKRFAVGLALGCRNGCLDREDIEQAVDALRALGQVCEHMVDMAGLESRLRSLIRMSETHPDNRQIANAMTDTLTDYHRWLDRVNNALIRVPNPLRPGTHLGEAVWQWTPDREYVDNNPEAAAQTLGGIVDALRFLNVRITGRLAEHAERVETTLGV